MIPQPTTKELKEHDKDENLVIKIHAALSTRIQFDKSDYHSEKAESFYYDILSKDERKAVDLFIMRLIGVDLETLLEHQS